MANINYSTPPGGGNAGVQGDQVAPFTGSWFGKSWNAGNYGGWRVEQYFTHVMNICARGISQWASIVMPKHGVGDSALWYGYHYGDGGPAALSDEGHAMITVNGGESSSYFHGVVVAPTGSWLSGLKGMIGIQPASDPAFSVTSGQNNTTDGCIMLNITKGKLAGNMCGYSQPVPNTFLNFLPVKNVTLPLTNAWGTCATTDGSLLIPDLNLYRNMTESMTFTMQLQPIAGVLQPFKVGLVSIAGFNYPEQAMITAVEPVVGATQSITMNVHNANQQIVVFQGGIAGQYLSFDANLALSGMRSTYYAFGSLTGTDLIYGSCICGSLQNRLLPMEGYEPAKAIYDPNVDTADRTGFHLYPGAEVVMNTSANADPILEVNGVSWDIGDVVENPHYPNFKMAGVTMNLDVLSPTNPSEGGLGIAVNMGGGGVTKAQRFFSAYNANGADTYRAGGGPLMPPDASRVTGPFGNFIYSDTAPIGDGPTFGALTFVQSPAMGDPTRTFDLFNFNWLGGGHITFDPKDCSTSFAGLKTPSLTLQQNPQPYVQPADLNSVATFEFKDASGQVWVFPAYKKHI